MRICRYNADRLGLAKGDQLIDVTMALDAIPEATWPRPHGDAMIANWEAVKEIVIANQQWGYVQGVNNVTLLCPVANPTKIIGAPMNYGDAAPGDPGTIAENGLFLKANSSLAGAGEGIVLSGPDRSSHHEIEIVIVIGREAKNVDRDEALDYVFGYTMGIDATIGGPHDRSQRKSPDSYTLLGPWISTADEIGDPDDLDFSLRVNGEVRQASNTGSMIYGCRELIEYASRFYTLYPGDVIMTGTPEPVGPLKAGDRLVCEAEIIGRMEVEVR